MADISMCPSPDCPSRTYCIRNEASGTQPSEWRQAWTAFTWSECEGITICDGYWPISPMDNDPSGNEGRQS